MNKLVKWLVISSENPKDYSMTIKGLLVANIGVIMFIIQYLNLPYTVEQVTEVIGAFTGFIGSALFMAGLLRKLANELTKNTENK